MSDETLTAGTSIVEALLGLGVPARVRGILRDPQIRSVRPSGDIGPVRTLAGVWLVIHLESDSNGDVRGLLSREGDLGFEMAAGEIVDGRIVTAVATLFASSAAPLAAAAQAPVAERVVAPAPAPSAPAVAVAPSPAIPEARSSSPSVTDAQERGAMPLRPPTKKTTETEQPTPNPGDLVEHFAFGRCEVVKSDGDRLHLKLGRDSRIKEIALEMLRVTRIGDDNGVPVYRLDRKQ
jgi:hypothetical protein